MVSKMAEIALLRGAFSHIKMFCEGRRRPGCTHPCSDCPLIGLCGDYLEDWVTLAHFAEEASRHIIEKHLDTIQSLNDLTAEVFTPPKEEK